MPRSTLTDLPELAVEPGDTDVFYVVADGVSKKIAWSEIKAAVVAGSAVVARSTTLTAAELADLHNTPVELVPAPGAAKALHILGVEAIILLNGSSGIPSDDTAGIDGTFVAFDAGDAWPAAWDTNPFCELSLFDTNALSFPLIADAATLSARRGNTFKFGSGYAENNINMALILECSPNDRWNIPGAIETSAIGAAGTGYVALETVTRGDATIRIDTVGGGGEVLTYTVTVPGTNNIIGDAQATTGGSGADFTLNITALDYSVNPMELKVKVVYSIFDLEA